MSPTLPAAFPPDPASVTCGPFRPIRAVGRGAHGTVFLAVGPEGRVFAANSAGEVLSLCKYEPGRIMADVYLASDS